MEQARQISEGSSPIGRATMSSGLPSAVRYHQFIFDALSHYLGKRVWEIGSGYGQYTKMLKAAGFETLASDIDPEMLSRLGQITEAKFIDLNRQETVKDCLSWKPDSIICLNVLEHIEEDARCLGWINSAAEAGTRAVFLTPAHMSLFGFMDEQAGHFRRYTRETLSSAFSKNGWKVEKSFYLNPIGGLGWFVRNRILAKGDSQLDSKEVNSDIALFDRYCVGPTKLLGHLCSRFFGQSVVVVAIKE